MELEHSNQIEMDMILVIIFGYVTKPLYDEQSTEISKHSPHYHAAEYQEMKHPLIVSLLTVDLAQKYNPPRS